MPTSVIHPARKITIAGYSPPRKSRSVRKRIPTVDTTPVEAEVALAPKPPRRRPRKSAGADDQVIAPKGELATIHPMFEDNVGHYMESSAGIPPWVTESPDDNTSAALCDRDGMTLRFG